MKSAVETGENRTTNNGCLDSRLGEFLPSAALRISRRKMIPVSIIVGVVLTLAVNVGATTYYVATNGNDAAAGTDTNAAWRTPERGIAAVHAGDVLYLRGGIYLLTNNVKTANAGTALSYCKLWAYPGENPVLNGTNLVSGTRGIYLSKDYWHVKGIEVSTIPDNGIIIAGGNFAIVEGCVIHNCTDDGITFGSTTQITHDNLILNCDSYQNYDGGDGNNGDGYSGKQGCGTGNAFVGCRAWLNSDDGWDLYNNVNNTVTLSNCWSFQNGSNQWNIAPGSWHGNGNGYKLGGQNGTLTTHVGHILRQCIAFDNHNKGFDQNQGQGGHTLYNCTAFRNANPNFSFYTAPSLGTNVFKNNISYLGGGIDIVAGSIQVSNSWQNGLSVTTGDFVSLDISLATAPRNDDYSLPTNGFARLASGSDLIDAGINVGLPYNGTAPDLGAYEFIPVVLPQNISIDAVSMTDTGLSLHVVGLTSHGNIIVHTSPDLTSWTPIFTNPPVSGGWQYVDPAATNSPQQFYKVQEQ